MDKKEACIRRSEIKRLLLLHIVFAAVLLLYGAYTALAKNVRLFGFCGMKEFLHIYCPFCGGTRAFATLFFHFDIVQSLKENILVFFMALRFVLLDITAIYSLIRKKEKILIFLSKEAVVWLVIIIFYCIVKNVLLIFYSWDPLGELVRFY